jgi:hypothetical protein
VGGREARQVTQQIWATSVDLPDGHKGAVTAHCIVACETEPPPGERAVEWRLLTNLPVSTLEQAGEMLD